MDKSVESKDDDCSTTSGKWIWKEESRKNWKENVWTTPSSSFFRFVGKVCRFMRLFFATGVSVFLSKTPFPSPSLPFSLSLGWNACHRKNGGAFKRWATKPPGAPRSSHVSKDIKSTRWRNMKCNDAAGGGKASDTVVHDVSRTRHRSSSISHAFGFSQPRIPLRFFRSSGRCVSIPLQLFGLFALASIHHRRLDLDEPPPSPSPPSSLDFGRRERNGEITTTNRDRPTDFARRKSGPM